MKDTPEHVIDILHSITKLSIVDGELEVQFDNETEKFSVREYLKGTFTRELLEFLQDYLLEQE